MRSENTEALEAIVAEIKFLESKTNKIKNTALKHERFLYPGERAQIKKFSSQQIILRKVARKIQKLNSI